jgi:hypothetical protein
LRDFTFFITTTPRRPWKSIKYHRMHPVGYRQALPAFLQKLLAVCAAEV